MLGYSTMNCGEVSKHKLDETNGQDTKARTGSVRKRTKPIPPNMLHTLSLISKILAQGTVLPRPRECVRQLTSVVAWYIRLGATFISLHFCATTQKEARALGVRRSCKMPCSPSQSNVGPRPESGQRRWRGISTGTYRGPNRTPMWGGY